MLTEKIEWYIQRNACQCVGDVQGGQCHHAGVTEQWPCPADCEDFQRQNDCRWSW